MTDDEVRLKGELFATKLIMQALVREPGVDIRPRIESFIPTLEKQAGETGQFTDAQTQIFIQAFTDTINMVYGEGFQL